MAEKEDHFHAWINFIYFIVFIILFYFDKRLGACMLGAGAFWAGILLSNNNISDYPQPWIIGEWTDKEYEEYKENRYKHLVEQVKRYKETRNDLINFLCVFGFSCVIVLIAFVDK